MTGFLVSLGWFPQLLTGALPDANRFPFGGQHALTTNGFHAFTLAAQQTSIPGANRLKQKRNSMKKLNIIKTLALVVGCAALVSSSAPSKGLPSHMRALFGNIGATFVIAPTDTPGVLLVTADEVGQSRATGNFTGTAQLQVQLAAPGSDQPSVLTGTATWMTSDGKSTIALSLTGTSTADPANPSVSNNRYEATITGGTGAFSGAKGSAVITEVLKFTSASTGTAGLAFAGHVVVPR